MESILTFQRFPKWQAHSTKGSWTRGTCWFDFKRALTIKLFVFQVVKKRNSKLSAIGFEEFEDQDWEGN
jgi:hypothetical protein